MSHLYGSIKRFGNSYHGRLSISMIAINLSYILSVLFLVFYSSKLLFFFFFFLSLALTFVTLYFYKKHVLDFITHTIEILKYFSRGEFKKIPECFWSLPGSNLDESARLVNYLTIYQFHVNSYLTLFKKMNFIIEKMIFSCQLNLDEVKEIYQHLYRLILDVKKIRPEIENLIFAGETLSSIKSLLSELEEKVEDIKEELDVEGLKSEYLQAQNLFEIIEELEHKILSLRAFLDNFELLFQILIHFTNSWNVFISEFISTEEPDYGKIDPTDIDEPMSLQILSLMSHFVWKSTFIDQILHEEKITVAKDYNKCFLGRYLNFVKEKEAIKDPQLFKEIYEKHMELHALVDKYEKEVRQRGRLTKDEFILKEVIPVFKELLYLLINYGNYGRISSSKSPDQLSKSCN